MAIIKRKGPKGTKYGVKIKVNGEPNWVGTYETWRDAKDAELKALAQRPRRSGRIPTVLELAGAEIHDGGKITMTWPDGEWAQKETGRKDSSVRRLRDGLRPFVREFGDRRVDSFKRDEALTWARARGANVQQAVRQFFNCALERELVEKNHFAKLGASKRKRRVDRPDFTIITDEEYARLCKAARESRADGYGLILEGAVLAVGETAMRPQEIFALHCEDVNLTDNVIRIWKALDLASGKMTWPKDDEARTIVMSPALRKHLLQMPRLGKILFPAPRGGYMLAANWSKHWHSIRATAGMPAQEFYELKHRAITWMINPVDERGLGLDFATAAEMVGHDDGGYLIATVYSKLGKKQAVDRAQRAMDAYNARQAGRHLSVVGGK
jgi:integrase